MGNQRRSSIPSFAQGTWYLDMYDQTALGQIAERIGVVLWPGRQVVMSRFDSPAPGGIEPCFTEVSQSVFAGHEVGVALPVLTIPLRSNWIGVPSEPIEGMGQAGRPWVRLNGDHVVCTIPYLFGNTPAHRYFAITAL